MRRQRRQGSHRNPGWARRPCPRDRQAHADPGLTTRDIYLALAKTPFGKPNSAKTWNDVNGKLPALPIRVYGPPPTSGTRDALDELIMTAGCEANPMAALKKANEAKYKAICTGIREDGAYIEAGENDNLIVQKLAANPDTSASSATASSKRIRPAEGRRDQRRAPTYQTISTFKYPGARPLYIYVKNAHVRAIPAVRAFVAEFTKESAFGPNGYLLRAGLIAAPNAVRARSQQAARNLVPLNLAEPQIVVAATTTEMRAAPAEAGAQASPKGGGGKGI